MLNTINNIICFGIGTLGCAIVFQGLLGVNPDVSSNTNRICKHPEAVYSPCKTR
jgi:hypothetical protein